MAPAYPVVSASHQMLWSAMPTFRRACGSLAPRFSGVPVPTQRSGLEGRRDPAVWVLSRPNFGPSLANFAANTCKHHILGSAETTGQAGDGLIATAHKYLILNDISCTWAKCGASKCKHSSAP